VEDLYRDLFQTQGALARARQETQRDSLRAEVRALEQRIQELNALRMRGRDAERDTLGHSLDRERLEEAIRESASRGDWEQVNQDLGRLMEELGGVTEELGRSMGQLQLEISAERFRLATEGGGYIDVRIPEELRQNLSEGVRALNQEMGRVLSDSMLEEIGKNLQHWEDKSGGLPELLGRLRKPPPPPKWRVIGRSIFKVGSDFRVASDELVKGDVVVIGGRVEVAGKVLGKVIAIVGDVAVEENGVVEGDAVSIGGRVDSREGATVTGQVVDLGRILPGAAGMEGAAAWLHVVMLAVRLAVLALLALILLALLGDRLDTMCLRCEESGLLRSFGLGLLWLLSALLLFGISSFALAVTIIGIPVVVLLVLGFGGLLLAAYFVTCRLLGDRILRVLGRSQPAAAWQSVLLGLVVLEGPAILLVALAMVISPGEAAMALPRTVDLSLKFLALALGFGCVVQTRFGSPATVTRARAEAQPAAS
jgi:hypothetical protein